MQYISSLYTDNKLLFYAAVGIVALTIVVLLVLLARRFFGRGIRAPGNGRSRQIRLGVVDVHDLDRERQLVLVRRDNIEHLIMIGGPNDLLIESQIVRVEARPVREREAPTQAVPTAQPMPPTPNVVPRLPAAAPVERAAQPVRAGAMPDAAKSAPQAKGQTDPVPKQSREEATREAIVSALNAALAEAPEIKAAEAVQPAPSTTPAPYKAAPAAPVPVPVPAAPVRAPAPMAITPAMMPVAVPVLVSAQPVPLPDPLPRIIPRSASPVTQLAPSELRPIAAPEPVSPRGSAAVPRFAPMMLARPTPRPVVLTPAEAGGASVMPPKAMPTPAQTPLSASGGASPQPIDTSPGSQAALDSLEEEMARLLGRPASPRG